MNKGLTKRECEIILLISFGNTDREIAEKLAISLKTANTHRKNIIRKLKLKNTAQLIRYAIENGIA